MRGIIEAKPGSNGLGEWRIGGQIFVADSNTEFRTDEGPLDVGVCVQVKFATAGNQQRAERIRSEKPDDC